MESDKKIYLLIGKSRTTSDPDNAGGVIVLFEQLLVDFKNSGRSFKIVDLNRRNYVFSKLVLLYVFFNLVVKIPRSKVVIFNGTAEEFKFYAWFVVAYGKVWKKKIVLRKFAGNFDDYYMRLSRFSRIGIDFAMKYADINYFETNYLVDFFRDKARNVRWFPNIRKSQLNTSTETVFSKRFVFISHVREEKGVTEILEAKNKLPSNYLIHLYGLNDYQCPPDLQNIFKEIYKGSLSPEQVIPTLRKYDVLVLPTYHKGEGYPGIIIEALSVGMPVITTPLKGIKEMIENGKSGIFVEPKNSDDLVIKMLTFNEKNHSEYREQAKKAFLNFDSDFVMQKVFSDIDK